MKSITVLIPAYNEEKLIERSVRYYFDYLKKLDLDFEIIICANGCTDNTLEISKKLSKKYSNIRILDIPQKGFGIALTKGIIAAKKDCITLMPGDGEIRADFIENALKKAEKYDYISASRRLAKKYDKGIKADKRRLYRRALSKFFSITVSSCFNFKVSEAGTVRLFPRKWAQKKNIKAIGFDWQLEQLYFAVKDKLKIKEIPVHTLGIRPASESSVNIFKDSLKLLFSCLKYGIKLKL